MLSTLDKHAPVKEKLIRGNNKPFITKELRKEIFKRSRLKNKANKSGLQNDISLYKKQRNYVCSLVKNEKRKYFKNINITTDQKRFWRACKPYLSEKYFSEDNRIFILKDGLVISDELQIAEIFNSFFTNITSTLNLKPWEPNSANSVETHG